MNIALPRIDDDFYLLARGSLGLNHSIQIDGYCIRISGGLDFGSHCLNGPLVADFSTGGFLREDGEFLVALRAKQDFIRCDKAHRSLLCGEGSLVDDGVSNQENIARLGMNRSEVLDLSLTAPLKLHSFAGEKVVIAHIPGRGDE